MKPCFFSPEFLGLMLNRNVGKADLAKFGKIQIKSFGRIEKLFTLIFHVF